MKRLIYAAFAVMFTACTADFQEAVVANCATPTDKIVNTSDDSIQGSLIVRFDAAAESRLAEGVTRSGATRSGIAGVDAVLESVGGYSVEPLFVVTDKNREKMRSMGMHLWYVVKFDERHDIDSVAADLSRVGEVKYVEFDKTIKRIAPAKPVATQHYADINIASTRAYKGNIPFNDTYVSYMWSLENLGEDSNISSSAFDPVVEADVNAVPAWRLCTGDPSIIVAVVDEGVMYSHEDLADNYLINLAEQNGVTGKDDDGNGYVDDIYGYNFASMSKTISWNRSGDTGHGTHVAGIVTAVNNNNTGVCSVAGGSGNNDGVKVFSAQIFNGNSGATSSNTAKAIQYAADRGAHILQCSWGYDAGDIKSDSEFLYYLTVEANAIDYFIKYGGDENGPIEGGLAIFAAGNEEYAMSGYPAAYEPCISVAAYSPSLKPAYYTNYSYGTDIIAPGGDALYYNGEILSTVPSEFGTTGSKKNYAEMQGTSMACPMVSSVAALGLSYAKQLGKRYTADEFRSMLLSATNDINSVLNGSIDLKFTDGTVLTINYPDYKGKLGAGAIDAYKLLLQIDGTPFSAIRRGVQNNISLAPYFGNGVTNATLSAIEISDSDRKAVDLTTCTYKDGELTVQCNKTGVATLSVTLIVGNGSISDTKHPNPTKVTKKFVLFVREAFSGNGGWL